MSVADAVIKYAYWVMAVDLFVAIPIACCFERRPWLQSMANVYGMLILLALIPFQLAVAGVALVLSGASEFVQAAMSYDSTQPPPTKGTS